MTSPQKDGFFREPEAKKYLLRTYAQSKFFSGARSDVRNMRQKPRKDEQKHAKSIKDGVSRLESVHESEDVTRVYIARLDTEVPTIFLSCRDTHRRGSYLEGV